jgi:hypothetical protein
MFRFMHTSCLIPIYNNYLHDFILCFIINLFSTSYHYSPFWTSASSLILEASKQNTLSVGWGYRPTPNAQRGGPACPFLNRLARKALQAATLPPPQNSELCYDWSPTTKLKYGYFCWKVITRKINYSPVSLNISWFLQHKTCNINTYISVKCSA